MQLDYIKEQECPECGAAVCMEKVETSSDGSIRRHVSGGHWETRKFTCGKSLEFSPNFGKTLERGACKKSNRYLEMVARRRDALDRVKNYITKMRNVDSGFKRQMRERLDGAVPEFNVPLKEDPR